MTAHEATSESGDESRLPTSRRSFLLIAGSTAGVGLSAGPASGGAGDAGDPVAVVASPSQRGPARDAVDGIRQGRSADGDHISIDVAVTTAGLRRFTAGDVDVLAGSRPILPAERSRAVENGVRYERRELPTATATLRPPESSWVDCLRPAHLAATWAGDGVVETWAEVDQREGADAGFRREPVVERTGGPTSDRREGGPRPARDGTVLVRGVRAHQYATGFGGVGYYEPAGDWLEAPPRAIDPGAERHTPIVRLAFLYADRESLHRQTVDDFVRTYARLSAERVGVPYFGDPFGGN